MVATILNIMKKKCHVFYIMFAIFFSIYAVSPILYTHECKSTTSQTDTSLNNLRLFFVDLFLLNLTHHTKTSDNKTHSIHVLLKKKRAIVSSGKLNIAKEPIENLGTVADFHILSQTSYRTAAPNNEFNFHKDFYQLHAGLSPPIA